MGKIHAAGTQRNGTGKLTLRSVEKYVTFRPLIFVQLVARGQTVRAVNEKAACLLKMGWW